MIWIRSPPSSSEETSKYQIEKLLELRTNIDPTVLTKDLGNITSNIIPVEVEAEERIPKRDDADKCCEWPKEEAGIGENLTCLAQS